MLKLCGLSPFDLGFAVINNHPSIYMSRLELFPLGNNGTDQRRRAATPCQWNCCTLCLLWVYCSSELCGRLTCGETYLELEGFLKGGKTVCTLAANECSCCLALERWEGTLWACFLKEDTHWDDMLTAHRVGKFDGFLYVYFIEDYSESYGGTIMELCSTILISLTTRSLNR